MTYYGHKDTHGRVSGLCFRRYTSTLLEVVNRQRLSKVAFLSSARELVKPNMKSGLEGILAAIKHLHSFGLVHNDINPANIMLDDDGTFILIDSIAVDVSGSRCATPKRKEPATGTTLLSIFRSRKMTFTISEIYRSG